MTTTKQKKNSKLRYLEYYDLQDTLDMLYADSGRRKIFNNLMQLIESEENIRLAYRNIKRNSGSNTSGVDKLTIKDIEKIPETRFVEIVRKKLQWYKPKAVRRVEIPKPNGKLRPLGIPAIWDRIVQQCILQILEPICEAKFSDRSNGFRPNRSAEHAIAQAYAFMQKSHLHYVVDIDIKGFFDNVSHSKLMKQMWNMGIQDKKLLCVIKEMLKAPIVLPNGETIYPQKGTPQGGILSPLLSNIVLNELDWWIASQWEKQPAHNIRDHITKTGATHRGRAYDAFRKSGLKEMHMVRYADDFKIFCRDYVTAKKAMYATKLWLAEHLHLQTSDEKSGITNLRKNYTTFLGIKFKVVPKGDKWIIRSHIADKSKDKVINKLRTVWKDIKNPSKQSEIDKNISLYNSMVMGMHNYYCMATMVSADFAEIAYKVNGKSNGMNHNNRCFPITKTGEITSKFIQQKYGKSKQFRWIKGRMIIPVGYVAYEYPKYKRREVNKYVRKYSDIENCISYDVMKYMMGNAHLYPTLEMADNALSRYIAQKGKCAVTHNALSITDMVCIHIKPCKGGRNDTYRNLIILSKDVSKLVDATENKVIKKLLQNLTLTVEMQEKINKLRKYRELEEIQFEDYIGTKM